MVNIQTELTSIKKDLEDLKAKSKLLDKINYFIKWTLLLIAIILGTNILAFGVNTLIILIIRDPITPYYTGLIKGLVHGFFCIFPALFIIESF